MPIAVGKRVTNPRLSQLIVEGTVALVASVLLVWLMLWFRWQVPASGRVWAVHLPGLDVPYLQADARGFARPGSAAGVEPTAPGDLALKLDRELAQADAPAVVVVAVPTLADAADDLKPLVEKIAASAPRSVVVALDPAQVDTDRDLGVFGNAPHLKLAAQLAKVKKGAADVVVIFPCAPGQKSWMADGLGRSVFSYFLQRGLAGDARGADGSLTAAGLFRYVSANVREWVKVHRDGAVQTPVLVRVGDSSDAFRLLAPDVRAPGAERVAEVAAVTEATPAAKGAAADPPAPRADAWDAKLKELVKEWEEHEALRTRDRAPYRDAPAAWRLYQAALLRADRLARASRHDPALRPEADDLLKAAARYRLDDLQAALGDAEQAEKRFPFRPATADPAGKKLLNDSLRYVTGRGLDELASGAPAETAPRPEAPGKAAAPGAREVNVGEARDPLPNALREAADGFPATYLELQLPAWALNFNRVFDVDQFKDPRRGQLLRDAVWNRRFGESALAADRRGLSWIAEPIRQADVDRRAVQDELFADPDDPDATERRTAAYGDRYHKAFERIEAYRRARSLYEQLAAELPDYGEWLVLEDARTPSRSNDPIPPRLADALRATAGLGLALELGDSADRQEREDAPKRLAEAALNAATVAQRLDSDYQQRVRSLVSEGSTSWREIDDALRTPLIRPRDRARLLQAVTQLETTPPAAVSSPRTAAEDRSQTPGGGGAADPGFCRKAVGLACLDVELRRLGAGGRAPEGPTAEASKLRDDLAELAASPEPKPDALEALTRRVRAVRASLRAPKPRAADWVNDPNLEAKVAAGLRDGDRDARFRSAGELRSAAVGGDEAVKELDGFCRRAALLFHARRLALDYAPGVDALVETAKGYYAGLPEPTVTAFRGALRAEAVEKPVVIDDSSRAATLHVRVGTDGEVPEGRAFVGALAKERVLRVSLRGATERPAVPGLPGALIAVPPKEPTPIVFRVEQPESVADPDKEKHFLVRAFYRGRVDAQSGGGDVVVQTRDFGPTVTVTIAQDLDALGRRLPDGVIKDVPDQFLEHPGEGYMHARGQLDYVLTFRNRTPQPQTVHIERALVAEEGAGEPPPPQTSDVTLDPRGTYTLRRSVTHVEVPYDKPKVLVVRVTNAKKENLDKPLRVHLRQLRLEDYIDTVSGRKLFALENDGRQTSIIYITVTRRRSDPVTDPILYRDMLFSIDKQTPTRKLDPNGYLARDSAVEVRFKLLPDDTVVPWDVDIEGEKRSGEVVIRKPAPAPK